jgi:hypothetical protein
VDRGTGQEVSQYTQRTASSSLCPFIRQLRNCSPRSPNRHTAKHRDAHGRAPDGTSSSTPADSAPDVPDEEFSWRNSMAEMQRPNGIRSFQSEFSNRDKFASHMSTEESAMSKPTVLQDIHLAFIRLRKRYRFTERPARELIPYMYMGPAACSL